MPRCGFRCSCRPAPQKVRKFTGPANERPRRGCAPHPFPNTIKKSEKLRPLPPPPPRPTGTLAQGVAWVVGLAVASSAPRGNQHAMHTAEGRAGCGVEHLASAISRLSRPGTRCCGCWASPPPSRSSRRSRAPCEFYRVTSTSGARDRRHPSGTRIVCARRGPDV